MESSAAVHLCEFLTCQKATFWKGNESMQKVLVEIIREFLNAMKYDEALQYLRYLSVTPDMTEIPLKELFFALLSLSGAASFRKLSLNRFIPGEPGASVEVGLKRSQVYEALFGTNRPFMLKLFANLESETDGKGEGYLPHFFYLLVLDSSLFFLFLADFLFSFFFFFFFFFFLFFLIIGFQKRKKQILQGFPQNFGVNSPCLLFRRKFILLSTSLQKVKSLWN
jgi:hypothetical protein